MIIPTLLRGQKPTRAQYNNLVILTKQNQNKTVSGFHKEPMTTSRMYATVSLAPYSIFPLNQASEQTNNTFYAPFNVEIFQDSNRYKYLPGLYGTNGKYAIGANSYFDGVIIDEVHDTPVIISDPSSVSDYEDRAIFCGLKSNLAHASIGKAGLVITGQAPFTQTDCYYVRRCDPGKIFAKLTEDLLSGSTAEVKLIDRVGEPILDANDDEITIDNVRAMPLQKDTLEENTRVIIEYVPNEWDWYVTAAACEPDEEESTGGTD